MILILIGLLITIYSFINYKGALYCYLAYQVFWHPTATMLHLKGLPTISISMFMNTVFFILFFVKYKVHNNNGASVCFPLERPFLVIYISFFASCFTSLAGFSSEFTRSLSIIIQDYLMIPIIWNAIDTAKDKKKLEKIFIVVFLLAGIYSLVEYLLKNNPLVNYKSTLNETGIKLYSETAEAETRGYRIVSFFEHPIGAGMTLSLFVIFIIYLYCEKNNDIPKSYELLSYVAVIFCLMGIILTKMRSSLLFLMISIVAVVNFREKRFYKLLAIACLGILIIMPVFKDNLSVFLSLFDKTAQKEVGGSSIEMRVEQFQAVYHIFMQSPISGLGERFEEVIKESVYTRGALGYESVWFIQMTRHGVIGITAMLYLAFYMVIKLPYLYNSKKAMFCGLAFWLTYTLTSIPSFRMGIFYLLYFYCLKNTEIYRKSRYIKSRKLRNSTAIFPSWIMH